jgi:hypothetical protein
MLVLKADITLDQSSTSSYIYPDYSLNNVNHLIRIAIFTNLLNKLRLKRCFSFNRKINKSRSF